MTATFSDKCQVEANGCSTGRGTCLGLLGGTDHGFELSEADGVKPLSGGRDVLTLGGCVGVGWQLREDHDGICDQEEARRDCRAGTCVGCWLPVRV